MFLRGSPIPPGKLVTVTRKPLMNQNGPKCKCLTKLRPVRAVCSARYAVMDAVKILSEI